MGTAASLAAGKRRRPVRMSPGSLSRGDRVRRGDRVHGAAMADETRQPRRSEVEQGNAKAPADGAEDCVDRGNPHVVRKDELETAGDGLTLHCHQHGHAHPGLGSDDPKNGDLFGERTSSRAVLIPGWSL
jgi:hypothetical protein